MRSGRRFGNPNREVYGRDRVPPMIRALAPEGKTSSETRVLLLRHAETSAPDRFHGAESDIGLGPTGQLQAEAAAQALRALRPDALYCSAMRRARETAEPIARACGLVPQVVAAR